MFTVLSPALDWLGSGRTKCVKGTLCLTLTTYIYIYLSLCLLPPSFLSMSSLTPFRSPPFHRSLDRSLFLARLSSCFFHFLFENLLSLFHRVARMSNSPLLRYSQLLQEVFLLFLYELWNFFFFFFFLRVFFVFHFYCNSMIIIVCRIILK